MTLIYFLVAIFISFFILYSIARHDFVLLRQNISLKLVFDNAFLSLLVAFFLGRLFFVIETNHLDILSPLKFLYLSKFWGVSQYTTLVGIIVTVYFLFRKRKNILRIFDIYALGFYPLLIFSIFITKLEPKTLIIKIPLIIFETLLFFWFSKMHKDYSTKDGLLFSAIFLIFSIITFSLSVLDYGFFKFPFFITQITALVGFISSVVFIYLIKRGIFNKS